jgi:hypothetical protein
MHGSLEQRWDVGKGESHMWPSIATAVVTIAVLVIVVAVRSKSGGHIQVKLPDAIIAAIAAALTMFLIDPTQFAEIGIGAGGVTVKRVIVAAVQQKVAKQVTPLPVPPLAEAEKGSLGAIPDLVQHQVEALEFFLERGVYNGPAIQQYLQTLTKYPFLRFVVFHNPNNTFFGMIDARKLLALLENQRNDLAFANLANLINRGSLDDRAQLAKLPGFVPAADAVTSNTNKRDVLLKMDEKNTDWLPVLTSDGNLQGIVDRSRLLASLIIDIANELEAATPKQ